MTRPAGLVTPDEIEDLLLDVLRATHEDHLAALERQKRLQPRSIQPFQTIDLLVGENIRLREDTVPSCLLGVFGTAKEPQRVARDNSVTIEWQLPVLISVVGTSRADTRRRRGWYAMTVIECLLNRVPRDVPPVDSIELTDIDFTRNGVTGEQNPRAVGEAQLTFTVTCLRSVLYGVLPPTSTTIPPGTPFGPPADAYTPPAPDPTVAAGFPQQQTSRGPDPGEGDLT